MLNVWCCFLASEKYLHNYRKFPWFFLRKFFAKLRLYEMFLMLQKIYVQKVGINRRQINLVLSHNFEYRCTAGVAGNDDICHTLFLYMCTYLFEHLYWWIFRSFLLLCRNYNQLHFVIKL